MKKKNAFEFPKESAQIPNFSLKWKEDHFPQEIFQYPNVVHLEIMAPKIKTIPFDATARSFFSQLQSLTLICPLLEQIPSNFLELPHLKRLRLKNCNLRRLEQESAALFSLNTLDLSHNKLTSFPASWILQLSSLETLILAENQLSQLPYEFRFLSSLRRLNLDGNHFSKLPEGLTFLPQLNHLSLDRNPLENAEMERMTRLFPIWFNSVESM